MTRTGVPCLALTLLAGLAAVESAAQGQFKIDVLSTTPVGSWQEREQTTTEPDGARRVLVVRTSRFEDETRGGEPYVWLEMEMNATRIDKKGRSKTEPPLVARVLLKRWVLESDVANGVYNPFAAATEVVLQSGENEPVRFFGKALEKVGGLLGVDVRYTWTQLGTESVTTPAGTFSAAHVQGSGTAQGKVLLRKIRIESSGDFWYSTQVPFGLVKASGQTTFKDKPQTFEAELKSYGTSGAVSKITQEPKDVGGGALERIFGP